VVGIVLVSHSAALARGLAELLGQIVGGVAIEAAGGGPDGGLGTSAELVRGAIERAERGNGVVVLADLGSAVLTVRAVLEDYGEAGSVLLADAPFVEGAVAATVTAAAGGDLKAVAAAAEEARHVRKL